MIEPLKTLEAALEAALSVPVDLGVTRSNAPEVVVVNVINNTQGPRKRLAGSDTLSLQVSCYAPTLPDALRLAESVRPHFPPGFRYRRTTQAPSSRSDGSSEWAAHMDVTTGH